MASAIQSARHLQQRQDCFEIREYYWEFSGILTNPEA